MAAPSRPPAKVSVEVRSLLQSAARAVLFSRRGSLFEQVRRLQESAPSVPRSQKHPAVKPAVKNVPAPVPARRQLEFFNGLGGFASGNATGLSRRMAGDQVTGDGVMSMVVAAMRRAARR